MDAAFDVAEWLGRLHLDGEKRDQARKGFNAGWEWASATDAGQPVEDYETAVLGLVEGHYLHGFDAGKDAFESGEYPGGLANY